jgi:hypothetical protein
VNYSDRILQLIDDKSSMFNGTADLSIDEWLQALRLFTLWQMETLRGIAIIQLTQLFNLDPHKAADKLIASQALDVPQWKRSAIEQLISRKRPIISTEARILPPEILATICELRELNIRSYFLENINRQISTLQFGPIECDNTTCDMETTELLCSRCQVVQNLEKLQYTSTLLTHAVTERLGKLEGL